MLGMTPAEVQVAAQDDMEHMTACPCPPPLAPPEIDPSAQEAIFHMGMKVCNFVLNRYGSIGMKVKDIWADEMDRISDNKPS